MRPETAQGIFLNFKRLYEFNRSQLPMAVAQIGKSFRNEINPKNGLIRQREFLMAEIEHFLDPRVKYEPFSRFQLVKEQIVKLFSSKNQQESSQSESIKLKEVVEKVIKHQIF